MQQTAQNIAAATFWNSSVSQVLTKQVKDQHSHDIYNDKSVRNNTAPLLSAMGTTSNLYPITVSPDAKVHCYTLEVQKQASSDGGAAVLPSRIWKLFTKALTRTRSGQTNYNVSSHAVTPSSQSVAPTLPAIVRIEDRIYATGPIPENLLTLPPEYYDLNWKKCMLRPMPRTPVIPISQLCEDEQQVLVNKLVPECISENPEYASVRSRDGKIVCVTSGISVDGIRVFEGVTAHAQYISGEDDAPVSTERIVQSKLLATIRTDTSVPTPLFFTVLSVPHQSTVQGRRVTQVRVGDSSKQVMLYVWDLDPFFVQGKTYSVNGGIAVSADPTDPSTYRLSAGSSSFFSAVDDHDLPSSPLTNTDKNNNNNNNKNVNKVTLALKLDTKCTIASEKSLWEEVQGYFGCPPYSLDVQRRINSAAEAMPVITSHTLSHGMIKILNFNISKEVANLPLDPQLRVMMDALGENVYNQPFAVMKDYSIWPIQALHCCFDPTMRAWQNIAVAACSYLPQRRAPMLARFRENIAIGLQPWGIHVASRPMVTREVAVLTPPVRRQQQNQQQQKQQQQPSMLGGHTLHLSPQQQQYLLPPVGSKEYASVTIFVGVPTQQASQEVSNKVYGTVDVLLTTKRYGNAQYNKGIKARDEADAIQQLSHMLQQLKQSQNKNKTFIPAVCFITNERQSRSCRWLVGEALQLGAIVCTVAPVSSAKANVLASNISMQLRNKLIVDPLQTNDPTANVPSLTGKSVLAVGVDACHTTAITTGAAVGILISPTLGGRAIVRFWRNEVRGQELEQVADNFRQVVEQASRQLATAGGKGLDEVIVFQDGSVFSELHSMSKAVPENCGLTFTCLHKRTHIRFHVETPEVICNNAQGTVVQSLTPSTRHCSTVAPSFYLQSHESRMSTARPVHIKVHATSPTVPISDLQQFCHNLAHECALTPTKLPLPTRCAHRVSAIVERLIDANPSFPSSLPEQLAQRTWYL